MTAPAADHRRPPDPPFLLAPGRVCHVCGAERPRNRTRYCSAACSDVMDYAWHPRWAAWKIATDTFGEGAPPRCFECRRTAEEAAVAAGLWVPDLGRYRIPGLELDHVRPLATLTDAERLELKWWLPFNLQLLCHWCHAAKTAAQQRERAWSARRKAWDATRERLGLLEPSLVTPLTRRLLPNSRLLPELPAAAPARR